MLNEAPLAASSCAEQGRLSVRAKLLCAAVLVAAFLPFLPALFRGEIYTLRDHTDYFIPLRHYTTQQLLSGELPLWNPLNGSGERWLANPQTAVFYPPALLFLVLPFATAYVLYLAMHVAILGAGAFFLFRRWTGDAAAFLAASSLALSGPVMSLLDVSNNLGTFAWFPLVIFAALRRGDAGGGLPLVVNVLLLAAMFLGGEPFLTLIGAAIYTVTMLAAAGRKAFRTVFVAGGLAMLLCAAQLLPFFEMLIGSDRAAGFGPELAFRESMHPGDWTLLSIPPSLTANGLIRSSQSYIPILYVGVPVVFFALAALVAAAVNRGTRKQRLALFWTCLLAAVVVISAGKYLGAGAELMSALGMNLNRYPARLVPLGALAVCALAAVGATSLREMRPAARAVLVATFVTVLILAAVRAAPLTGPVRPLPLVLLAAELALLIWFTIQPRRRILLVPLAIFVIADLILASAPLRESKAFPRPQPEAAALIGREGRIARLAGLDTLPADVRYESMPGYTNLMAGIQSISTAAPVSDARYARFHDHALYTPDAAQLQFLSARYLMSTRPLRMGGITPLATIGPTHLHTFDSVWPMATVWDTRDTTLSSLDAMIEDSSQGIEAKPLPDASAEVLRMDGDEATIRVSNDREAVVVLNQLDARGWSVTVDGVRAEDLRAGVMFRAVRIPAGEHIIRWHYQPDFFVAGVAISVITLLLLVMRTIHLSNRARGVVGWRAHAKDDDFDSSSHHGSSGFHSARP